MLRTRTVFKLLLISACLGLTFESKAQTSLPGSASPAITYFNLAGDKDFKDFPIRLRRWSERHPHKPGNDFCTLGFMSGDGTKAAWIIWPQGKRIFHWFGRQTNINDDHAINLGTDVVETENELHGSTFLTTQAWVKHIENDCKLHGQSLHFGGRK